MIKFFKHILRSLIEKNKWVSTLHTPLEKLFW